MKLFKKIDLYFAGDYLCSTNQSKTCREAKRRYIESITYLKDYNSLTNTQAMKNPELVKARFSK
jgi:hypothetical protein